MIDCNLYSSDIKQEIVLDHGERIGFTTSVKNPSEAPGKITAKEPLVGKKINFGEAKLSKYNIVFSNSGKTVILDTIEIFGSSKIKSGATAPFKLLAAMKKGSDVSFVYSTQGNVFLGKANVSSEPVKKSPAILIETGISWDHAKLSIKDGKLNIMLATNGPNRRLFVEQSPGQLTKVPESELKSDDSD